MNTATDVEAFRTELQQFWQRQPVRAECLLIVEAARLYEQHTQGPNNWRARAELAEAQVAALIRERDAAKADAQDADAVRERLAALLTATANTLKGEPAPPHSHDWSDLPEVAGRMKEEFATAQADAKANRDAWIPWEKSLRETESALAETREVLRIARLELDAAKQNRDFIQEKYRLQDIAYRRREADFAEVRRETGAQGGWGAMTTAEAVRKLRVENERLRAEGDLRSEVPSVVLAVAQRERDAAIKKANDFQSAIRSTMQCREGAKCDSYAHEEDCPAVSGEAALGVAVKRAEEAEREVVQVKGWYCQEHTQQIVENVAEPCIECEREREMNGALARIDELMGEIERLRATVKQDAEVFRDYEALHQSKVEALIQTGNRVPQSVEEKAALNREHAERCEKALRTAPVAEATHRESLSVQTEPRGYAIADSSFGPYYNLKGLPHRGLILVMSNDGHGWQPWKICLPHQLHVDDVAARAGTIAHPRVEFGVWAIDPDEYVSIKPDPVAPHVVQVEPAATSIPVCSTCNDTHMMPLGDRTVMCTRCLVPCHRCRVGGNGAFCATTPCPCACHTAWTAAAPQPFGDAVERALDKFPSATLMDEFPIEWRRVSREVLQALVEEVRPRGETFGFALVKAQERIAELEQRLSYELDTNEQWGERCQKAERELKEITDYFHAYQNDIEKEREQYQALLARLALADGLAEAAQNLLGYVERGECCHEETHRGGVLWTICNGCDRKWADDEGGFVPYVEPPDITAAREALTAYEQGKPEEKG